MFTIKTGREHRRQDFNRRDFLSLGAARRVDVGSACGCSVPSNEFRPRRRCVLLFLTGGPPQLDTWDLKPNAPAEIRGELQPIATSVPGIAICELLPRLSRQAHRYCLVRSVTHGDTVHTSAGYAMLTGVAHPLAGSPGGAASIRPSADDHPHVGSVVSRFGTNRAGAPPFVALPEVIRDAGVNEFPGQDAGFLGRRHGPVRIEAAGDKLGFRVPDLVLPDDVNAARLQERGSLRRQLDQHLSHLHSASPFAAMEHHREQAIALLRALELRHAFDLDREPRPTREAYGQHLFGQGCLLARRLIEAGVTFVTVYWHYDGPDDSPVWDTHWNNFTHLRTRLMPPTDQALATLLEDLGQRGLLEDTLILCLGEFGRTPRINGKAGRDHWPHVQSVLLAGAGIPGGSVYGASDPRGAYPADRPVAPADLTATLLHLLGIAHDIEAVDRLGRPLRLCRGQLLSDLVR